MNESILHIFSPLNEIVQQGILVLISIVSKDKKNRYPSKLNTTGSLTDVDEIERVTDQTE